MKNLLKNLTKENRGQVEVIGTYRNLSSKYSEKLQCYIEEWYEEVKFDGEIYELHYEFIQEEVRNLVLREIPFDFDHMVGIEKKR